MRAFKLSAEIAAVLAVIVAGPLRAQEDELAALVNRLPSDCLAVAGTADAPAALEALRPWVAALLPGPPGEGATEFSFAGMLGDLAAGFSGPLVVGVTQDGTWRLIARTERTQPELLQILLRLPLHAREDEGLIGMGPYDPVGFVAVHDGLLIGAGTTNTVNSLRAAPVEGQKSLLDDADASVLLGSDDVRQATLFFFSPRGPLKEPEEGKKEAEPFDLFPLQRRLEMALKRLLQADGTGLCCLHIAPDSIRLTGTLRLPGREAERPAESGRLNLPETWPVTLTGSGGHFASVVDWIEHGMAAFDPDVGAEFREEMQELNADLGYDFQRDFLGNLGPAWGFGILPAEAGGNVEWVWACSVRDREEFLRCAEGLARLAQEAWDEKEPAAGARRFSTRAFTVPVEIAVGQDRVLIAPSAVGLQKALDMIERTEPAQQEAVPLWETWGVARFGGIAELLPDDEDFASLRNSLSKLPADARVVLHVWRLPETERFELSVEGVTCAALGLALEPSVEQARRRCMANLHEIGPGIAMYRNQHRGQYPATLAELYPRYVERAQVFWCPADKDPVTIGEGVKCSYHYVGKLLPGRHPMAIIAHDRLGNHEGGRNALFGDSHVEWLTEDAFQGRMTESLRLVKQKDWDKYTPEQQKAIEAFYAAETRR